MTPKTAGAPFSSQRRPHRHLRGLAYEWQALLVVIVGSFMVMLDTTVVNVALPKIIINDH